MAQVKKLQNGGIPSPNTKKRIYNGVELSDDDINNIISTVGNWGASNSNYTEDIQGWGNLGEQVKKNMLNGNIPIFKTTGTGMTIGDLNIEEGKTNQNIFGNWSGNKLANQYTVKLKEALDKYTKEKTNINSNKNILTTKIYTNPKNIIAKNDFGDNYEAFDNNWNNYDLSTRKNKLRNALIQSINEYGDSDLKSRLPELNNQNIDDKILLEIGNKTGYDYSELLNGSSENNKVNSNKYDTLKQYGNKLEDDYLKSKGLVGFRDNNGITRLFNDSDLSEYNGNESIETNYGQYYGYGMFKDPNKGWFWGNKNSFLNTPVYSNAEKSYANIRNQIQQNLKSKYNNVDFNNEESKVFGTPYFNQYRDNNKFEFLDVSGSFTGINQNSLANRLIIPKKTASYDDLGAIDLQNSQGILIENGKQIPVKIKLNSFGESIAIDNNGIEHSLGAYGDSQMNQMNPWNSFKTNIDLGIETPKLTESELQVGINSIQGFNNKTPITKQNFNYFLNQIIRKNYKNDLTPEEANHLANTLVYYYNTVGKGQYKDDSDINKIKQIIKELTSNSKVISNNSKVISNNYNNYNNSNINYSLYRKNGGIIKAQVGATLTSLTSNKNNKSSKITLEKSKKDSYSGRIRDINNWNTSDTLDAISTGLDAASLAGGAVGVGAGLASTLVQAVSDSNRSGFMSGEMLKNLGINLGFTALAFIPGASAVKVGKIANTANKLSHATKFLKDTEKAVKILSKTENLAEDAKTALKAVDTAKKLVSDAKKGKDVTKFIDKVTLNPITKTAATAARTGFATIGISNGINSASDIIQDVNNGGLGSIQLNDLRGLVGGVAGTRAAIGIGKNALIRKGTEPIKSFEKKKTEIKEDASKWSKAKTKMSDFKENTGSKVENYFKNKVTDTWQDRKLKSEEDAGWLTRQGIKVARKTGFTENGLGVNEDYNNLSTILNNARFKESLTNYIKSRPINKLNFDPKLSLKLNKKLLMLPEYNRLALPPRSAIPMPKYSYSNKLNAIPMKKFTESNPNINKQLSLFKEGGKLISKFQNSGEIISGQRIEKLNPLKTKLQGVSVNKINQPNINLGVNKTNLNNVNTNNSNIINSIPIELDPLNKKFINIDTTSIRELPKLISSLSTNEKNRRLLSSIQPALLQNPTEIYKPVVTNLANEIATKNQVSDFLRRSAIPMTSDATLQKAGMLEAISKTTPLLIQAKAENTNAYNQSLENSLANSEKYSLQRNEVANQNRQMITAKQEADARYNAGKLIADNASISNFLDKNNQIFERNQMYKKSYEQSKALTDLQNDLNKKLKPFKDSYDVINNDYTKSNTFNKFNILKKQNIDLDWNSNIGTGDLNKTWKQLYEDELKGLNDNYNNEYNRLYPTFNDQRLKISNSNPYLSTFNIGSYKTGGEFTAQSRVEVQKLRNKLKEKELDNKYINESLNRKQKEVLSILNGLSKETFFLLKTVLGK